jgi:hypothetical protein
MFLFETIYLGINFLNILEKNLGVMYRGIPTPRKLKQCEETAVAAAKIDAINDYKSEHGTYTNTTRWDKDLYEKLIRKYIKEKCKEGGKSRKSKKGGKSRKSRKVNKSRRYKK